MWQPGYQTFGIKCDQLASTLLSQPDLGGHNWVAPNGGEVLRADDAHRVRAAARLMDARRTSIAGRLVEPAREALLPFVLARVVVLGVLALAHFIVDRTDPSHVGVAARVHEGLLGWDAGFYETIARVGYAAMGTQSLRFYPAVPALTHAVAWLPGVGDGTALLVVSNVAAYVATVLLYILVRRETRDALVARRAIWFLSLAPAAYVLVMGYAESTLLCLAIGCFLALRPAPAPDPGCHVRHVGRHSHAPELRPGRRAGVPGRAHPAHRRAPGPGRGGRAGAVVGPAGPRPAAGRSGGDRRPGGRAGPFGVWSHHEVGDFWAPLSVQFQSSHHGALADPVVTVYHDVRGLWHGHVGTALHVPWVVLALILLVVCWRKLPASYTVFSAAVLLVAVAGSNLDSFERYALSAFPLTIAAALICGRPVVERVVLVLLPAALAAYALLAFLNISVP